MQIKVTLGTIKTGIISKGKDAGKAYASAEGSTVHYKTKGDKTRTVMAFAESLDKVADIFVSGAVIDVTAFANKGSVVVTGPARQKVAAEDEAAAA